jgi:F-type H+-transporting ATPase subunit epsilon/F-type H+-transporting ATPase subunit delta
MDKNKIEEMTKQAEKEASTIEISDQNKYLVDQKIDTLKSLN